MSTPTYSARRRLAVTTLVCMLLIFGGIALGARLVARHEFEELFSARLATSARVQKRYGANSPITSARRSACL